MPRFCAVVGCGRRGDRDARTNSFYRLPCIPKKGDTCLTTLKTKRRMAWILALRRADMTETKLKYAVICDRHFISGQPANVYDIDNPDWVPSINMGYDTPEKKSRKKLSKPNVEYIKRCSTWTKTSNKGAGCSEKNIIKVESNVSEIIGNSSRTYESMIAVDNISDEDTYSRDVYNDSDEEYEPEKYVSRKLTSAEKNSDVADMFSEENILQKYVMSELVGDESEFDENMTSKKVQTDLTMVDLENLANAFKDSAAEVNNLKAKLKVLSEDVVFLDNDDDFYP